MSERALREGLEDFAGHLYALGAVAVPTPEAVATAISQECDAMNIEGRVKSEADAVFGLIVYSRQGTVMDALEAARAYDAIHGTSVSERIEERL